jgi:predicted ATPase/class 3 adenylate cyclase
MAALTSTSSPAKRLTFLFTDIESSTRLWEQFPDAMKSALERHDTLLQSAVESSNGQVVKATGDGLLAIFGRAQDGVNACLKAQQSLFNAGWGETGALKVRMGLHIGEAQSRAGDYFGPAVNRTARLMAIAHGGQVLLTAITVDNVKDNLPNSATLRDLGEHRLKDLERPVHVYQLLHPDLASDFPPIASLNRRPNNLPIQPTAFIGRNNELTEIKSRLKADDVRLITLTGPGGTGKTRLALQASAELIDNFTDGVYIVDLAPIRDPEAVFAAIARNVGLNEKSDQSLLDALKEQLQGKRMLLLLDNFEQVTAAAVQVSDLLQYCPQLKLLVTSREALRVRGELLYPVPPLAIPEANLDRIGAEQIVKFEAVQLFVERAQSVKPGFELTSENARAVAEICLSLDGLPLAIELAAARIRLFSPQALRDRLDSRLRLLRGGARDLPERQQTLRDTIEWSYDLLDVGERRLFELLSVFSGSSLEAVELVASDSDFLDETSLDILDAISALVDKSLIRRSENGSVEPRFKMLKTIKEYASDRLSRDGDLERSAIQAHAVFFSDLSKSQWESLSGLGRDEALEELALDIENIQSSWKYWVEEEDFEQLSRMVDSLWLFYDSRGWYQASVELAGDLLKVLATSEAGPERIQQQILLQTSLARGLMAIKGYTSEVEDAYRRALDLCKSEGAVPQLFPVLRGLSSYYTYRAEFDKGAQIGEQILKLAKDENDRSMLVHGHLVSGINIGFLTDLNLGLDHFDQGIAIYDSEQASARRFYLGSSPGITCLTTSAFFLWMLGFPDRAINRVERAIELAIRLNHPFTMAYARFHTGVLHMWRREMALAQKHANSILTLLEEHEFPIWKALANVMHGASITGLGQVEDGLAQTQRGMDYYQGLTTPPVFWPHIVSMHAGALLQGGKAAEGLNLLEGALESIGLDAAIESLPQLALLRGDLVMAISSSNEAEAKSLYKQALAIAENTKGRMLALQSATRLCRLGMLAGDTEESGWQLREVYGSFTEGFSTADLVEARALLDELGR